MTGKTILIVEDCLFIGEQLRAMLEGLTNVGSVDLSPDCYSAIKRLANFFPDLVLLDIHLPGCSGLDLLRYIKRWHPVTDVVILTNEVDNYYRRKCKELGAAYFMDKSSDFCHVPDIVSSMLQTNACPIIKNRPKPMGRLRV